MDKIKEEKQAAGKWKRRFRLEVENDDGDFVFFANYSTEKAAQRRGECQQLNHDYRVLDIVLNKRVVYNG